MNDFKLEKHAKIESGFKVPNGYFDGFEQKIMEHLPVQEPKGISFFERNRTWIMSVAAILALALMIPAYTNFFKAEEEIDAVSMENYLTYQSNISQ